MAMIKWTAVTAKKTPRPNVWKAATKASKAPERSPTTSVVVETVAFGQPARPPQCSSTCTSATMLLWGMEERVQRGSIRGREPEQAAEGEWRLPGVGRREERKEPRPKQAFLICT